MNTRDLASRILLESSDLRQTLAKDSRSLEFIEQSSDLLKTAALAGKTIYACGNGGSACDAMHLTEELVARYKRDRPGIRAVHFCDPGVLTCWGNDKGFDEAFARCAETFCQSGDILVALSTSGKSKNVLAAVEAAKAKGAKVIALNGKDGGSLVNTADLCLVVPSNDTERIQEIHITIIHIWCEILDRVILGIP